MREKKISPAAGQNFLEINLVQISQKIFSKFWQKIFKGELTTKSNPPKFWWFHEDYKSGEHLKKKAKNLIR